MSHLGDQHYKETVHEYEEPSDEDINKAVDAFEEGGTQDKYHFEVFLSTDGKHTVHVTADDEKGKRKALRVATDTFDYLLSRYGTKQGQAVKEYSKDAKQINQEDCNHVNRKFLQVKKEGKNQGRWFSTCPDCKKFLGWKD